MTWTKIEASSPNNAPIFKETHAQLLKSREFTSCKRRREGASRELKLAITSRIRHVHICVQLAIYVTFINIPIKKFAKNLLKILTLNVHKITSTNQISIKIAGITPLRHFVVNTCFHILPVISK